MNPSIKEAKRRRARSDNERRIEQAMRGVEAASGGTQWDIEADEMVTDTLANIMHLCRLMGIEFDELADSARIHFEAESKEAV